VFGGDVGDGNDVNGMPSSMSPCSNGRAAMCSLVRVIARRRWGPWQDDHEPRVLTERDLVLLRRAATCLSTENEIAVTGVRHGPPASCEGASAMERRFSRLSIRREMSPNARPHQTWGMPPMCRSATVAGRRTANTQREKWTSRQDTPPPSVRGALVSCSSAWLPFWRIFRRWPAVPYRSVRAGVAWAGRERSVTDSHRRVGKRSAAPSRRL
jgi:hypothetical protein